MSREAYAELRVSHLIGIQPYGEQVARMVLYLQTTAHGKAGHLLSATDDRTWRRLKLACVYGKSLAVPLKCVRCEVEGSTAEWFVLCRGGYKAFRRLIDTKGIAQEHRMADMCHTCRGPLIAADLAAWLGDVESAGAALTASRGQAAGVAPGDTKGG